MDRHAQKTNKDTHLLHLSRGRTKENKDTHLRILPVSLRGSSLRVSSIA